jgi:hypothetical protein
MRFRNKYGFTFIPADAEAEAAFQEPFVHDLDAFLASPGPGFTGTFIVYDVSPSPGHPSRAFWVEPAQGAVDRPTVNVPRLLLAGAVGTGRWGFSQGKDHLFIQGPRLSWMLFTKAGAYEERRNSERGLEGLEHGFPSMN